MAIKKSQLYSSLWQGCDELRGGMDASQYKDYVLVLLFVRYVSDKFAGKKNALVVVPEGGSFDDMVKLKGKPGIGEGINLVLSVLAEANGLVGVINSVDFNDEDKLGKGKDMQDRLSNLVAIFENEALDFSKNKADDDDLLGDAFEYLMKHFAVESGKSKGQFYTPAEVSRIMAKVIGANQSTGIDKTVYDPACGSGSLLLKVAAEASKGITIYGQELDNATAALAIMNMWLHGEPTAEIKKGQSTLSNPLFLNQDGTLKTYDFSVANPPFSYKSWRNGFNPEQDLYERFTGYGIPPTKNGDYAFLLHMIRSLKSTGKGAIILPHGVLFRGNAESAIRQNIIKRGYIKGIIGLPANLFYGTSIPACIIVLDKETADSRKGIFVIDASKEYVKDGNKNRLRDRDMRKIIDTFIGQLEIEKYSRFIPNEEIEKNEYNLNIPRYIDTQEPEDIQDIEAHLKGGIPSADIEIFSKYWEVCPGLKKKLFKAGTRQGYNELTISPEEVKKTILTHDEFTAFRSSVLNTFDSWRKQTVKVLGDLSASNHPKILIQDLGGQLLTAYAKLNLIDKYDIYQHLMSYWSETMQDDVYIIISEDWKSGNQVVRLQKGNKDKKKDVLGLSGLEGRLIPISLCIITYFSKEQKQLDDLSVKLEQIVAQMEELNEEYGGEEGLLAEVLDNDKVSKVNLAKRIKIIKDDKDYKDEFKVLADYQALYDQEADTKKAIKDAEQDLEKKIIAQYPKVTVEEIKNLVIERKWMDALKAALEGEVDRLSKQLAGRVKELAERYRETLPEVYKKFNETYKKVESHIHIIEELLTGKRRLPGYSGEWGYTNIENLVQKKKYAIVDGPFGSQMKVEEFVNAGIPIIEMEQLNNRQTLGDITRYITKKKFDEVKRSAIYPGDIIISKTGTLGLLGVAPSIINPGVITSRLAKISVDTSKADPSFVFHWLRKLKKNGYWERVSQGGTMQILGTRMLKEAPIPNIGVEEQSAIAKVISDMDNEIENLESMLEKHHQIKVGMMQQLLTGKIRLYDKQK